MMRFAVLPVLFLATAVAGQSPPGYTIALDTALRGYDGKTCWVHPRAGIIPGKMPVAIMTMLKLTVTGTDLYSPTWDTRSDDLGKTWSTPVEQTDTLGRRPEPHGVEYGICDFSPQWHAPSRKLLAIGHTVRYKNSKVVEDRARETAYAVYDEAARTWSPWATVTMPDEPRYFNSGAGCAQRVDLPDGTILLPTYYKLRGTTDACVAVMKCKFDGKTLTVEKIGNELKTLGSRGFGEPSLTLFKNRYYLTLRNDQAGYVCSSADGLNFDEPKKWCFDDGTDLGNYNTQQHWVTHSNGFFLVYTRKGAMNDHVFRYRAPLFIAQVDPVKLQVIRATEKVLISERGARLGNFGVVNVSPTETWVTVAEWMQTWPPKKTLPVDNPKGADNSVYIARILWAKPNDLVAVETLIPAISKP
ncbi:hypothetical protein BH11PLA2_BH11PLA2_40890 [soil metagenome]